MNASFHELVGIALAQEVGARATQPPGSARSWAAACLLAVASHGVLDALPHYYPLQSWEDAAVSLVLVGGWCLLVPRWMRGRLLLVCVAALLPDIIDHVPDDLRKRLGLPLPVLPNLFPWHWPAGQASWPGRSGPKWVISVVNHLIVVVFCAAAVVRTRQLLSWPGRRK
jgi:hypothetical protein